MDKSMLGDLDSLPEEDKMRMAAMVDQLQIRDRFEPYERIPDILLPVSLATSRC
jgi:import inner membrane translocase subunit TIM9